MGLITEPTRARDRERQGGREGRCGYKGEGRGVDELGAGNRHCTLLILCTK